MTDATRVKRDRFEDDELAMALRAYADARLSPDQWASTRMRVAVIEAANDALRRGSARPVPLRRRWGGGLRAGTFAALVAVLSISIGASAALAASPGGPFYGVRLWIEDQTLPASGQARTDAQIAQIDERVDEATVSADESNDGGVGAALAAYGNELDSAFADAGQDPTKLQHLQSEVSKHIAVLEGLLKSNPAAAAAIQRAIDHSNALLARIADRLSGITNGNGNGGNGGQGGNGGNGGNGGTGGNGGQGGSGQSQGQGQPGAPGNATQAP
jgi:hypothetical protein